MYSGILGKIGMATILLPEGRFTSLARVAEFVRNFGFFRALKFKRRGVVSKRWVVVFVRAKGAGVLI